MQGSRYLHIDRLDRNKKFRVFLVAIEKFGQACLVEYAHVHLRILR